MCSDVFSSLAAHEKRSRLYARWPETEYPPSFSFKDGICLFNSTPKLLRWPRAGFSILSQVWYIVVGISDDLPPVPHHVRRKKSWEAHGATRQAVHLQRRSRKQWRHVVWSRPIIPWLPR